MPENFKSLKDIRKEAEKKDVSFAGWEALEKESRQDGPDVYFIIKDSDGSIVNTVKAENKKGFNRVNWDLTYARRAGESLDAPRGQGGWMDSNSGMNVVPGTYSVTFVKRIEGKDTQLAGPVNFEVKPLYEGALPRKSNDEIKSFITEVSQYQQDLMATRNVLSLNLKKLDAMQRAADKATRPVSSIVDRLYSAEEQLQDIQKELNGDSIKEEIGERTDPTASDGSGLAWYIGSNTYGPTAEHQGLLNRVKNQIKSVKSKLKNLDENVVPALEKDLKDSGAPYIEGQGLIDN